MNKPGHPLTIHNYLGGHAAKLEKVHFLTVAFQHAGLRVGQTDERQVVLLPVCSESVGILRSNHQDGGLPVHKFLKVLTQLRHMRTAERSGKTPVEHEQDILFPFEIGEPNTLTLKIIQREIRSSGV